MIRRLGAAHLLAAFAAAILSVSAAAAEPADTGYRLISAQSSLTYTFTQAGGANQGSFRSFSVSFDPVHGRLSVVIDMRSFETGDAQRDAILGGPDMFDVARYPEARFTSARLERTPAGFVALGSLTIRGVTRPASVPFKWHTEAAGRIGFLSGQIKIHRLDFGIGQGQWKGTEWVGNDVIVHYVLQLKAQ